MTSALHGAGLYQFDLRLGGWFGLAGGGANASRTAALWDTNKGARAAVVRAFEHDKRPQVAAAASAFGGASRSVALRGIRSGTQAHAWGVVRPALPPARSSMNR